MKKYISLFLVIGLIFSIVMMFSSCANTDTPEESNDTEITTYIWGSIGGTGTMESHIPRETTGASAPREKWEPDINEPWNYTPGHGIVIPDEYEEYDVTLDQTVFTEMPESLLFTIRRKDGRNDMGIRFQHMIYLEKRYDDWLEKREPWSISSVWVRLPYYTKPDLDGLDYENPLTWRVTPFNPNFMKKEVDFTPGYYRILVILPDGPHYLDFEITG